MRASSAFFLVAVVVVTGCAAGTDEASTAGGTADSTESATLQFLSGHVTRVIGAARAGRSVKVEYALDRLPDCRGNLGGGAPAWNVTGFVSENGGLARAFEVTALSADGRDRVAIPALVPLTQGGDAAFWFQVSNRWGCTAYDSAFGQNHHVSVEGPAPDARGVILFAKDGRVEQTGELVAGDKVRIRYEQDRLPGCRRVQGGNPQWAITGFASISGDEARAFQTGRQEGSERVAIDALVDLPRAGELSLWFQVVSVGGCNAYDSKGGANYRFVVR